MRIKLTAWFHCVPIKAFQSIRILCLAALGLGSALACNTPAHSQGGIQDYYNLQAYDPKELAMLPRYCRYTQLLRVRVPGGNDQGEIDRWYKVMGPSFHHMHHYCYALMYTNWASYFARTKQDRMRSLDFSLNEFDYVIRNSTPNFVMLPEILTKKGENLIRLSRGPLGILELQRAVELKPDYWPPYAALSDYYNGAGNLEMAREWLEKGLSVTPDVKQLKSRLVKLEGVKDKPTPPPQ